MIEERWFAARHPDVLLFRTEPLQEDITVVGDIKPDIFISSSGIDSDFIVKLINIFPDNYSFSVGRRPPENSAWTSFQPSGYQMLLRGESMPARFCESFEKPILLEPNKPTRLSFLMPGISRTFKKGHRITIQSAWFPLVARNPQKFMPNYKLATQSDFQKVVNRVYFGQQTPSSMVLPVLEK